MGLSDQVNRKIEAKFKKQMTIWTAGRESHETQLRPQLGRPDAARDLQQLVDKEMERCGEVKQAIVQVSDYKIPVPKQKHRRES